MVHVTTPRPSLGAALGRAAGGEVATAHRRGVAQNALTNLQTNANAPNQTASDQLFNILKAQLYLPEGVGRSLGPLYETLLANQGAGQLAGNLPGGGNQPQALGQVNPQNPNMPVPQAQAGPATASVNQPAQQGAPVSQPIIAKGKTAKEIEDFSNKYLSQIRPDLSQEGGGFGAVPTFDFSSQSGIRPEEEKRIREDLQKQKVLPAIQDQVIQRVNQDIQNKYNEALQRYKINSDQQNQIEGKWNTVKQDSSKLLAPFIHSFQPKTQEFLTNRFFQYAGRQPTNLTPEAVEGRAMASLQPDIDKINALAQIPSMNPVRKFSDVKGTMDNIKRAYKPLKDAGMVEVLKEDAVHNKDLGIEEMHEAIWGDQTNRKILNEIGNIKPGDDQEKYVKQLASKIRQFGPDDDLVLGRAMVLGSGGTIDDYAQALDLAQQEGLKLSPFQENQIQEIQLPRQRPIWEIFSPRDMSPSAAFGLFGLGFDHFINYIRGKK